MAKPANGRSTRIRIESPLVLLASRSKGLEPPHSDNFRVMRVQSSSSAASTSNRDRRSQIDRVPKEVILGLLEEVILSLLDPRVIDSSSKEVPTTVAGTFGTTLADLKLEASAIKDYKLAHELFTKMLLSVNANKLLAEPHREMRKATVECFIWVS